MEPGRPLNPGENGRETRFYENGNEIKRNETKPLPCLAR